MRHTTFSEQEIESLRPAMKVGLLATVNEDGLPHITLLSSLQAASSTRLTFGQFIEGRGKCHVRNNPRVGFLVMTLQRDMWRGRALFTGTTQGGAGSSTNTTRSPCSGTTRTSGTTRFSTSTWSSTAGQGASPDGPHRHGRRLQQKRQAFSGAPGNPPPLFPAGLASS